MKRAWLAFARSYQRPLLFSSFVPCAFSSPLLHPLIALQYLHLNTFRSTGAAGHAHGAGRQPEPQFGQPHLGLFAEGKRDWPRHFQVLAGVAHGHR